MSIVQLFWLAGMFCFYSVIVLFFDFCDTQMIHSAFILHYELCQNCCVHFSKFSRKKTQKMLEDKCEDKRKVIVSILSLYNGGRTLTQLNGKYCVIFYKRKKNIRINLLINFFQTNTKSMLVQHWHEIKPLQLRN